MFKADSLKTETANSVRVVGGVRKINLNFVSLEICTSSLDCARVDPPSILNKERFNPNKISLTD